MEELKLSIKLLYSLIIQLTLLPFRVISYVVNIVEIVFRVIKKTIDSFIHHVSIEALK